MKQSSLQNLLTLINIVLVLSFIIYVMIDYNGIIDHFADGDETETQYKNAPAPAIGSDNIDDINQQVDGSDGSGQGPSDAAKGAKNYGPSKLMKNLEEMDYDFNPSQDGFFQLGTFLIQWGLSSSGVGGKNEKNKELGFALTPFFFFMMGFSISETKPQAWETSVTMHKEFDQIFGAMAIPHQQVSSGSDARYNLKVISLGNSDVSFQTMEFHSPFFWMAYGYRARKEEKRDRIGRLAAQFK